MNLYASSATFDGVRVYGLDRNAMINGQPANAIGFTIAPAALGDQYGLLPATWGAGSAPPAGQPEWFMNINSSTTAGAVENQVFVRRFHVDFTTPANSTFGVGAGHTPDGIVTVNGFVDAFTSATPNLVPNGTNPGIRYAGHLASDPANDLAQGESVLIVGTGHQTSTTGLSDDYSATFVDPSDGCTFGIPTSTTP